LKGHHFTADLYLILASAVLAAAVVAVMIVRFQAAPVPLERDEGEYALMGQLILDGTPPYSEAANMKLPGTYYAYSAILAVFGQTATGIHLGLMAVSLISTVILYLIAMPLLGASGAALAAAAFVIMSADTAVLGLFAHATHFVVMFALAGTWLLLRTSVSKHRMYVLWGAGICFGLAFLMKQSGAFFGLFGLLWVLFDALRTRPIEWKGLLIDLCTLAGGIILPYAVVLAIMAHQGVFDRFWFWTVDYARTYASQVNLETGIQLFQSGITPIIRNNPLIWSMAATGMIGIWLTTAGRRIAPFLTGFFLFSFLAVCPGFFFRHHYFVQLLPAVALGAGAALWALGKLAAGYTSKSGAIEFSILVAVVAFLLTGTYSTGRVLAELTPDQVSRAIYDQNPFPESVKIAEYLKENTKPGDRIAVMGSEPQICFYAHRRSATEHIYMYELMEPQPFALRMQEEVIAQVEKSDPRFLVLVPISTSWLQRRESERKIFSWMNRYLENYRPVMVADIYPDHTRWLMDKEAESFTQRPGSSQVIVFKRKNVE
jgi:hypothetical protein